MFKDSRFLARVDLLLEEGRQESTPDLVAFFSSLLNLIWFGCVGLFIVFQERFPFGDPIGVSVGSADFFFWLSLLINYSLLVKSRTSFIFTGVGMGAMFLLYLQPLMSGFRVQMFFWHLAGEAGEHILLVLGFSLAIFLALGLVFLLLSFQASKSRIWARRMLLAMQATFLTLSLLMMLRQSGLTFTPGGITLALAVLLGFLLLLFPAIALWYTQKQDNQKKRKIYWAVFTIQLVFSTGVIYYFAVSPEIRHFGEPANVRELRLGDKGLSSPLVEGDVAYLVSRDGRLLEVNLVTGKEKIVAHLLIPEPSEVGLPPGYTLAGGAYRMIEGVISRQARDKLSLKFVYSPRTAAGELTGEWTMAVGVKQRAGQVSWQLQDYEGPASHFTVLPVYAAGIGLYPSANMETGFCPSKMHIKGTGIETLLAPRGSVLWTWAGQGWLLAGTDRGVLYIIGTELR